MVEAIIVCIKEKQKEKKKKLNRNGKSENERMEGTIYLDHVRMHHTAEQQINSSIANTPFIIMHNCNSIQFTPNRSQST